MSKSLARIKELLARLPYLRHEWPDMLSPALLDCRGGQWLSLDTLSVFVESVMRDRAISPTEPEERAIDTEEGLRLCQYNSRAPRKSFANLPYCPLTNAY